MTEVKIEDNASTSPEEVVTPKNDDTTQISELLETASALADSLKKAEEERENYKQGMLLREKKLKDLKSQGVFQDDEDDEDKETKLVNRVVEALRPIIAQPAKQEESITEKLNRQVAELKLAVQNRSQVTSTSAGNSTESTDVKTEFWSPAQLAFFKERGLDPNKVKANMTKAKENAA